MVIIGLIGKKGVGKTEVDQYLQKKHNFKQIAFADALKETIQLWYPDLPEKYLHDPNLKESNVKFLDGKTPRQIMQTIGTDLVRDHYDENLWVNVVKRKLSQLEPTDNVVISDIRFQNELDMLAELNLIEKVLFFRIIRQNQNTKKDLHSTENQELVSPLIVNIYNDGSLEELFEKVEKKII